LRLNNAQKFPSVDKSVDKALGALNSVNPAGISLAKQRRGGFYSRHRWTVLPNLASSFGACKTQVCKSKNPVTFQVLQAATDCSQLRSVLE
jgi:hypothetical protein